MQVLSFDLENLSSIAYSEKIQTLSDGYHDVGLDDFMDDTEKKLIRQILTRFAHPENINWDSVATIQLQKGVLKGIYGGTVWADKDGSVSISFGANSYPLKVLQKIFYFGDVEVSYDPKGETFVTAEGKKITIPAMSISSEEIDEDLDVPLWNFPINLFFDSEKCKVIDQLKVTNEFLKTGDTAKFASFIKVKGSGNGYPVKLVDVVRIFHESGKSIPTGGLQFKVIGFDVQPPPETNPQYGTSLVVLLDEPVPFPVLYKERKENKETGRVLPYNSPVTRLLISKAGNPTKTLVDQSTGQLHNNNIVKMIKEWATGDKGVYLMITDLDHKEPDRRIPSCQLVPGKITNDNVQKFAAATSQNNLLAAQNSAVPFDDVIDAEAVTVAGDDDF